jgi:hypothetical protein
MGMIEQELYELRTLAADVMAGKYKREQVALMLGIYNQTAKRQQSLIQISAIDFKEGKKGVTRGRMIQANLISEDSAIPQVGQNVEMVNCKELGTCVTRGDCLDYSGAERNIDACGTCPHFSTTRKFEFNRSKKLDE